MATANFFSQFPLNLGGSGSSGGASMDILSDTLKLTLHTSTYTPNQTTHALFASATNEVANGSGYTTGGAALASKTYATSSLVTTFDAADVTWSTLSKTHRYGILWDDTPTTPLDPMIGYIDTGGDQVNVATDLTYQWSGSGIYTLTVA